MWHINRQNIITSPQSKRARDFTKFCVKIIRDINANCGPFQTKSFRQINSFVILKSCFEVSSFTVLTSNCSWRTMQTNEMAISGRILVDRCLTLCLNRLCRCESRMHAYTKIYYDTELTTLFWCNHTESLLWFPK